MSIVTRTWRKLPGDYFFIATKSRDGKWKDKAFHRDEFDKVDEYIEDNEDKNLYWCLTGFTKPRRKEEFAVKNHLLWADLDEVDPRKLNGTRPTMAWESSPNRFAALWLIDKRMTKELNKRLTYSIGADKGGWDITQVLRIPGTLNYKYGKNGAPGRLLWNDFPKNKPISVAKLKQHLVAPEEKKDTVDELDSVEVYKKYQKRINERIRQLLMTQAISGDRSAKLWKIWHGLFDAGMSTEEAIAVIKPSKWNKFVDRPDQLAREAEKVMNERLKSGRLQDKNPQAASEESDKGYISMDDVVMRPVKWMIPGWLPEGKITIIEGDPGVGKSWIIQYFCVQVLKGDRVPCTGSYGQKGHRGGRVLYVDLENDPETDTKPRILDMGLPEEQAKDFVQYYRPFSLTDFDQFEEFEEVVKSLRPKIIVFDTIMLYMGGSDTHKASDVQQTLSRLSIIAQEYECAVVLIRHLGKSSRDNIKHAGLGSIAFTGMARMVHMVREHPKDEEMTVIKTIKANFCKPEPALQFSIEPLKPKAGRFNRAHVALHGFDHELRDADLMGKDKKKSDDKPVDDTQKATRFLAEMSSGGFKEYNRVILEAEKRTIQRKTIDRLIATTEGIRLVRRAGKQVIIWSKD